jgi:hypothetical protein
MASRSSAFVRDNNKLNQSQKPNARQKPNIKADARAGRYCGRSASKHRNAGQNKDLRCEKSAHYHRTSMLGCRAEPCPRPAMHSGPIMSNTMRRRVASVAYVRREDRRAEKLLLLQRINNPQGLPPLLRSQLLLPWPSTSTRRTWLSPGEASRALIQLTKTSR